MEEEVTDEAEAPFMAWAYLQRGGPIVGSVMLYRSPDSLVEDAERQLEVTASNGAFVLQFGGRQVRLAPDSTDEAA